MLETKEHIGTNVSPSDLMKIRTDAVKASVENRAALLIRRLVCELELDEDELASRAGFSEDLTRFEAILVGVETPTKPEIHHIAHAVAELVKGSGQNTDTKDSDEEQDRWTVYTDGGFRPEIGTGAWSYIVVRNGKEVCEDCGHVNDTSSHLMETLAMLNALKRMEQEQVQDVTFISDNRTLVDMIASGTVSESWCSDVKCSDLREIYRSIGEIVGRNAGFTFEWTKSHSGNPWNEACDSLCAHEMWKRKGEGVVVPDGWTIYTNGSLNAAGKGRWCYIAVKDGNEMFRGYGPGNADCLQEMELKAIIKAMNRIRTENLKDVTVYSPNKAVCDSFRKSLKKTRQKETKVQEAIREILSAECRSNIIKMVWNGARTGDPWIEKCAMGCGRKGGKK